MQSAYKCPQCRQPLEQVTTGSPDNEVLLCPRCGKVWSIDYISGWWDGYWTASTEHAVHANAVKRTTPVSTDVASQCC